MPDAPDEIALSPHGHLTCPDTGSTLHEAFRLNESAALIQLAGKRRFESGDGQVLGYWRGIVGELLRLELNLTRRELADRLGVSSQTVANWEKRTGRLNLQPRTHRALASLHADAQA